VNAPQPVNPFQILRTLAAHWGVILACAVTGLLVGVSIALLSTPRYRAETLLSFNSDDMAQSGLSALASQFSGLSAIAGLTLGNAEGRKNTALALLTSRGFLADFITDNALLPVLFHDRWDSSTSQWIDADSIPTVSNGVEMMTRDVLVVSEDRRTGLVRIAVEWTDRSLAAQWANEFVRRANDVTRHWAIAETKESQEYLNAELKRTDILELRNAINSLIEAELKKEMIANVRVQYSFKVIDEATSPDEDDYVWPNKLVVSFFGGFFGFCLGVGLALVVNAIRQVRSPERSL
jgi:uncharacterized protein involved in exopolysaccharide biosynthesis